MAQLEKSIENSILCFLRECGLNPWKNQTTGIFDTKKKVFRKSHNMFHRKGVPDIMAFLPTKQMLFIEVKSKTGRPTPEQMQFISEANTMGHVAFISRSVEQTYNQLLPFWPELATFSHILRKYDFIEHSTRQ